MKTRKTMLRAAAFAAAFTLTAGFALPVQGNKLTASPLTAYAEDSGTEGKSGPLTYMMYSDHVEIIGCDSSATSAEIPETIEGLPVTVIGIYAFQCSDIKSVTIPSSVTEIGHYAFNMCSSLESVTFPESVKKIGIRAFEYCSKLTEVNFPSTLIQMNSLVFESTPWIAEQRKKDPLVIVNGALIDGQNCEGDIVIPDSVKYVSPSTFARNEKVTSVVFPSKMTEVCDNVCFYASNVESVDARGAVTIGSMAFDNCDKLVSLKLSNKLKSIDGYAFADNDATATITFYGSKDSWDAVEKPEDDPFLQRANIVFVDSPIEEVEGDVNADGEFNISDLVLVQKWLTSNKSDEIKNWKAGDFISDDKLDVYDLIMMRKKLFK